MGANPADSVAYLGPLIGTEINEQLWDVILETHPKAILLETFGSGSVAEPFLSKVRATTRKGVPVFLVNGSERTMGRPAEESIGIVHITYDTNRKIVDAGAIPLESANMGHLKRFAEFKAKNPPEEKYPGKPTDNLLEVIGRIMEEDGNLSERIQKIRKTYELTEAEIETAERQSHRRETRDISERLRPLLTPENADSESEVGIPITREQILASRRAIDMMLVELEKELKEGTGEGGLGEARYSTR